MNGTLKWVLLLLGLSGCGREIFYVRGCAERLRSPYKQQECFACVQRPLPHVFLPDNPDGSRCARR